MTNPLGEIMSSSITGFVAEAWSDANISLPGFGGLVKAKSHDHGIDVIGVVFDVVTGPQDSLHKPTALKMTREQLRLEQPHIFSLLRTDLHVVICGHQRAKSMFSRLPPHPPSIHDFVYPLSRNELIELGNSLDFLQFLMRVSTVPADELLASCLRNIAAVRENEYDFLVMAGKHLSQLYRNDYDTLTALLRKINPDG